MATTSNWGRLQVLVNGVDYTYFRGVPVVVENYSFAEPFSDATAVLRWPQITQFEYPGTTTAVNWLVPWANIDINRVDPSGNVTNLWEGMVSAFEDDWNDDRGHLITTCFGAVHQLSLFVRAPAISDQAIDIGTAISDQFRHTFNTANGAVNVRPSLRTQPMTPVVTGLFTRFRGDWSDAISFIQQTLDKYGMDTSDPVNLLTQNQASGEAGTTTGYHANNANTTIANTTAQALNGTHSFSLTSVAAGDMIMATDDGTGSGGTNKSFTCNPGVVYSIMASFRAAASPRTCQLVVAWYDNAGNPITSNAGDVTTPNVTDTTSGWTQAFRTVLSPPNAVTASMQIVVLATGAANEVHYVDCVGVAVGNNSTWAMPSTSPLTATQWTVAKKAGRIPYMKKKDRTTVNWTIAAGGRGQTISLRREMTQERNVIYADAQDSNGAQWTNSFPNGNDVFYQPLAYDPNVHEFDVGGGGVLIDSPARVVTSTVRNETHVAFGQGVRFVDGVRSAQQLYARDTMGEDWVGTITLKGDPAEGSRMDIREGHNILIANYRGLTPGLLLHIAAVEVTIGKEGTAAVVKLTVDSKARDLPTLAAIMQRNREVNRTPMYPLSGKVDANLVYARSKLWDQASGSGTFPNAPDPAPQAGTSYSPYTGVGTDIPAGQPVPNPKTQLVNGTGVRRIDGTSAVQCPANQWSIIKFLASERDQIVRSRIYSSPAVAFSACVFNYPPQTNLLGDPTLPRHYEVFAPPHMIVAWGAVTYGPDAVTPVHNYAGYSPGSQVAGDVLTGVLDDSAPWNYNHDDDTESALVKAFGPITGCSMAGTTLTVPGGVFTTSADPNGSQFIGAIVTGPPGVIQYGSSISSVVDATHVKLNYPCQAPGATASGIAVSISNIQDLGIHSPFLWLAIYPIGTTSNFYGYFNRGPYQAS